MQYGKFNFRSLPQCATYPLIPNGFLHNAHMRLVQDPSTAPTSIIPNDFYARPPGVLIQYASMPVSGRAPTQTLCDRKAAGTTIQNCVGGHSSPAATSAATRCRNCHTPAPPPLICGSYKIEQATQFPSGTPPPGEFSACTMETKNGIDEDFQSRARKQHLS